jgi:hypothetical protein
MPAVVSVPTIVIGGRNWIFRQLVFMFSGPLFDVSLSRYDFHLLIQDDTGATIYEDPIGRADTNGRLDAGKRSINMRGGQLVLSGLRTGKGGMLGVFIQGRSPYTRHVHGETLIFKVEIQYVQASSTDQDTTTLQQSDPTNAFGSTATAAP